MDLDPAGEWALPQRAGHVGGSKLESLTILGCVLVDGDHGLIPDWGWRNHRLHTC